jgi:hypothetical protein
MLNPKTFGECYGKVTVLFKAEKDNSGRWLYWCVCECGKATKLRDDRLNRKRSSNLSCGCSAKNHLVTHNLSKHELYGTYTQMMRRCTDPNSSSYGDYGGRGITVCGRWSEPDGIGLRNFIEDMGNRPQGFSLERKDNDGPYSPDNCAWADRSSQNRNRRKLKNCTSDYKGVSTTNGRYSVTINLGLFETEEEAALAYDDAYEILFNKRPNKTERVDDSIGA